MLMKFWLINSHKYTMPRTIYCRNDHMEKSGHNRIDLKMQNSLQGMFNTCAQIVCDYIRLKILGCVGVVVIAANRIWKVGSWLARLRHNSYATLRPPLRSRDRKMTWHLDGKVRICVTSVAGLSFVCRMNGKFSGQTNSAHANAEDIPPENPKADHMRSIHSRRKYISVDWSWWRYRWLTFTNTMYSLCSPFRFWRSGMARENREWTDIEDIHRWVCTQCPHSNDRASV